MQNKKLTIDSLSGEKFKHKSNELICQVSKASREIMLFRVCNGYKLEFPFCK